MPKVAVVVVTAIPALSGFAFDVVGEYTNPFAVVDGQTLNVEAAAPKVALVEVIKEVVPVVIAATTGVGGTILILKVEVSAATLNARILTK